MKVAFDDRGARDARGVGRYVRCLLAALLDGQSDARKIVAGERPRRADVFHSPWIDGALLRPPCPMVVTLHDLVPLKRRSEYLGTGLRFRMRYLAVRRAARLIVPTGTVAADAVELLNFPRERIDVIPEAPSRAFHPVTEDELASVRQRYALPSRYLLWVGGLEHPDPRKRVAPLADTPRRMPLVLVGKQGRWAGELPNVLLTGQVPDADLAAIYTGAHALIFPSNDEGFGLPPVEALACGTPVAASDLPVLREVLGERADFVEPGDLAGLVAAAEAATRPAPPPPSWTWEDAAGATWRTYERASSFQGPAAPS